MVETGVDRAQCDGDTGPQENPTVFNSEKESVVLDEMTTWTTWARLAPHPAARKYHRLPHPRSHFNFALQFIPSIGKGAVETPAHAVRYPFRREQ